METSGAASILQLRRTGFRPSSSREFPTEARVGIGPFSPQLRDKNAHFPGQINLNLLKHTKPILTGLVSVLVSADEQVDFLRPVNFHRFKCHWLARFGTVLCLSAGDLKRH